MASDGCAAGAAVQALAEALQHNCTVTIIELGMNHIGDEGAKARFGCQYSLVLIPFERCAPDSAVEAMGEALTTNSTIALMDLRRNAIGDEGAKARGSAFVEPRSNSLPLDLWMLEALLPHRSRIASVA